MGSRRFFLRDLYRVLSTIKQGYMVSNHGHLGSNRGWMEGLGRGSLKARHEVEGRVLQGRALWGLGFRFKP